MELMVEGVTVTRDGQKQYSCEATNKDKRVKNPWNGELTYVAI